jgi:predicted nucleotidyltransferase
MSHHNNITRIKAISNALGPLGQEVVFVGGATISLYLEQLGPEVRPTNDIDVVIELWNYTSFVTLEDKLRSIGFVNDRNANITCRYTYQGITVDIMPTDEKILGFSNMWYPDGYKNAMDYQLDDQHRVKIFSPPYFLATKFEAFANRGKNDGRTSEDFEDIVFVLEHRRSVWKEMEESDSTIKDYLKKTFGQLLLNKYFVEWIDSNIEFTSPPSTDRIMERIGKFVSE